MTKARTTPETPARAQAKTPRPNEKLRARTRAKLMSAARVIMGRQGIESTAISDITTEAGVAFGSFYNYFSSKEEVARAVFIDDSLALADMLDRATLPGIDIAEAVAANIRKTLHHGLSDPIWGWFLVQMAHSINDLAVTTIGLRLDRDLVKGARSGRFIVANIPATVDCIIGGFLYFLRHVLEGRQQPASIVGLVEFILCGLGIDRVEAQRIARQVC